MFAAICSAMLFAVSFIVKMLKKVRQILWLLYCNTTCASCSGIEQKFNIKNDNTYVLQSNYLGEKDGKFTDKGTYSIENDIITTTNEFKE